MQFSGILKNERSELADKGSQTKAMRKSFALISDNEIAAAFMASENGLRPTDDVYGWLGAGAGGKGSND